MLRWEANAALLHIYRSENEKWETVNLIDGFERNDLFLDLMRHFIDVVEMGAEPACTLDDGIAALKIALAVHDSAKTGEKVALGR